MKSKRRWLLLLPVLTLFAWTYQAASWRPKLVGAQAGAVGAGTITQGQLLVSPDGKRLISGALSGFNAMPTRSMTLWDPAARKVVWQQRPLTIGWMKPLAFSPDSRLLAVISDSNAFGQPNRIVDILDADSGKLKRRIASVYDREIQSVAFLSNRALATATSRGAAVIDVESGEVMRQWKFRAVAFVGGKRVYAPQSHISADGKTILALANGKDVTLYDSATGQKTRTWTLDNALRNPRLSPDGTLWTMERTKANLSLVYDAATGQQLGVSFIGDTDNSPWIWSADSQNIVSPHLQNMVIADARTRRQIYEFHVTPNMKALALSPNTDALYTLDNTGKIWRWRLR